ncbi:MAG: hypothetical protein JWO38_4400 [Gemmataceae bacterium]|nr:hypothetical protein [Gemmataceae bacterium]
MAAPPAPTPGRAALWLGVDLTFGFALPAVCLALDPLVFRGGLGGRPLLGPYAVAGYTAVAVGMAALAVWLLSGRPAALLAGVLAGGAGFALGLGLLLLPFTLIGLLVLIGFLGFTPFLTGGVFARHAYRAWRAARSGSGPGSPAVPAWAAVGLAVAVGLPCLAQERFDGYVRWATSRVRSEDSVEADAGVRAFERLAPLGRVSPDFFDWLVLEYEREGDDGRRERLAEAYRRLTGQDAGSRLAVLRD